MPQLHVSCLAGHCRVWLNFFAVARNHKERISSLGTPLRGVGARRCDSGSDFVVERKTEMTAAVALWSDALYCSPVVVVAFPS